MQIVSRQEARVRGLTTYFTGKPCKYGHTTVRKVYNRSCWQCAKEWRDASAGWRLPKNRQYRQANAARLRSYRQQLARAYPEKGRAQCRRYQAAKLKRTPIWASHTNIKAIYAEAEKRSKETGTPHHVDHVLPLKGKFVSGLHVENNLQILPWLDNLSKGSRHV